MSRDGRKEMTRGHLKDRYRWIDVIVYLSHWQVLLLPVYCLHWQASRMIDYTSLPLCFHCTYFIFNISLSSTCCRSYEVIWTLLDSGSSPFFAWWPLCLPYITCPCITCPLFLNHSWPCLYTTCLYKELPWF